MTLNEQVESLLRDFIGSTTRIVLAFSGGLDSCVLLNILASGRFRQKLLVWHVNHGLLDCAAEMQDFCQNYVDLYGVDFKVNQLDLDNSQSNLEAIARQSRYAVFEQFLSESDILLTAHHADDQAETFFLNLLRGAGSAGLRGIAQSKLLGNARVIRPLLGVPRERLEQYASQASLKWFEDPSNQSERFDRNYLRHQILPLIKNRWPGYLKSIQRVCRIQSETQQLLDEIADVDYQCCRLDAYRLCQIRLIELSIPRQKNVIRYWLRDNQLESLPTGRLEQLVRQLKADAQSHPLIRTKLYDIRIYQSRLYLLPKQDKPLLEAEYAVYENNILAIKQINLEVSRDIIFQHFCLPDEGQLLSIRFNLPGVILSDVKHRLKRLFQKHKIPPWKRDQTPLVFVDGELQGLWLN